MQQHFYLVARVHGGGIGERLVAETRHSIATRQNMIGVTVFNGVGIQLQVETFLLQPLLGI